jgi:hypothetical protein
MNYVQTSSWLFWLILISLCIVFALCFRPIRIWLRSVYLYRRGADLAHKATKFAEYARVGHALDQGYNNEKSRYKKKISNEYGHWGRWTQAPIEKRVETLTALLADAEKQQRELEFKLAEEKLTAPRQRIRVRDGFYYPAAGLLFIADIGFTYLCVQVLGLSPLFIFPMALILGGASWFLGDALGKEIEPELEPRTPAEHRKHLQSIIFLISANVVICGIAGTIRFSYTRREMHGDMITTSVSSVQSQGHANLGVDLISSYGILIAIILASVVLGWLHQGMTTAERIAALKRRCARLQLLIKRANRTGLRFHDGFDRTWKGRTPRGVQTPASPLEGVDTILKGLTWPPSMSRIEWPQQDVEIVDLDRYYDTVIEQEAAGATQQFTSVPKPPAPPLPLPSPVKSGTVPPSVQSPAPQTPTAATGRTPPPPTIG